jgi:hypothetical protein
MNSGKTKKFENQRKADMFPFTEIGAILQNIFYQLIRKDNRFINVLLA